MMKAIATKEKGKPIEYPEGTQHYKDCHWQPYSDHAGRPCLQVWEGKSMKASLYRYSSENSRTQSIQHLMGRADNREANREERKKYRAENLEKQNAILLPGQILHYSWGYEQTQCEFFIVTRRSNSIVWIQKIGAIKTQDTGWASANYKPDPEVKTGPEIRKKIQEYGVSMPHGIASPCGPEDDFHCSWYA
ncbi:MAG: hypothetical protein K2W95_12280 [Candidatus Obscuribacterales bacterium]|nr:hypothetical protein [Candidatus Obscuribacterales bacterium]